MKAPKTPTFCCHGQRASKRRGRKAQHYRTSDDRVINGLARRPSDGRWRIIGTSITFSEPSEAVAIYRFRLWQAQQRGEKVRLPVATLARGQSVADALRRTVKQAIDVIIPLDRTKPLKVENKVFGDEVRAYLREQLLADPKLVAEKTAIPKLAHYPDWQPPADVPP